MMDENFKKIPEFDVERKENRKNKGIIFSP